MTTAKPCLCLGGERAIAEVVKARLVRRAVVASLVVVIFILIVVVAIFDSRWVGTLPLLGEKYKYHCRARTRTTLQARH